MHGGLLAASHPLRELQSSLQAGWALALPAAVVAKRFPLHGQCLGVEHKLVEFDAESVGLHGPKSQPEQVKAEQLAGQLGAAAAGLLELLEWLGLVAGLAAHGRAKLFALAGWALSGLVAGLAAHETGWAELFALGWALSGLVAGLAAHETGWAELFALGWALPGLVAGLAAHETGWAELFALGWALPGLVAGLAAHETGWAELFALGWALPGLLAAHETGWAELFALGWALGLPGLPGLAVASVKLLSLPQSPPQVFAHLLWPAVEL